MKSKPSGSGPRGRRPAAAAGIEIAFGKSADRPTARYVSNTSVHEEGLENGRWIGLYWSASGQVQREDVVAGLPGMSTLEFPLHAFDLEIDGQDLRTGWELVSSTRRAGERAGTSEAVVELRHQFRAISVSIITTLDGSPFFARRLEVTNLGKAPAALSRVSPWSGVLWSWGKTPKSGDQVNHSEPFSLGHFDGSVGGSEGNFRWETLPPGWRRIEATHGKSGCGNPFFVLRNNLTGETAMLSLAWSGNWLADFWHDPYRDLSNRPGRGFNLAFRTGPAGPAPLRVIEPGETIVTPVTHLGIMHGSMDQIVAAWHGHLRASVIPPRPKGKEFYSTAARVVEQPGGWIEKEIAIAVEMGVDAFMIDAGWYGHEFGPWQDLRGDWSVGPFLPGGLAACRKACHDHGLLFGLWLEPEAIGLKSRLLKEHPEWSLQMDGGKRTLNVLDLAHPEAAAFLRNETLRVIREQRLDFFKIDYNFRIQEGGQRERHGFAEHEAWRHYETLYATFDQVRREMPEVALECCSGGGGRNDLGMMSRFHYACESDYSMFPRSIRAINGLTLFLPPEALCYYHNHMPGAHQTADLDTHLRVTLFAQPIFVGFGAQDADRHTPYFEKTRRYIDLARQVTGPILGSGPVVHHHTPNIGLYAPADWCVLEYAAQDRSRGYAGVFRLTGGTDDYHLRLRGVDAAADYEVTLDNTGQVFRVSGRALAGAGLPMALNAANTSELVLYRRVSGEHGSSTGQTNPIARPRKKMPKAKSVPRQR